MIALIIFLSVCLFTFALCRVSAVANKKEEQIFKEKEESK